MDRYTLQENRVRGSYVVVAASAIETARMLLNSKSSLFPNGLANSSGQVGRNLVEDVPRPASHGRLPQLEAPRGLNEDSYAAGVTVFIPLSTSTKRAAGRTFAPLRAAVRGWIRNGRRGRSGLGPQDLRNRLAPESGGACDRYSRRLVVDWKILDNFVDIDPGVKDAWGIPAVRIHFNIARTPKRW